MRRPATWLVVGGIVLLAGVAVVEALRGDDERAADRARATQPSSQPGLPDRLEAAGASGLLYVSVRRGAACRIQSIRLPTLDVELDVPAPDCRFAVAQNGMLATGFDCDDPGALLRPDGAIVDRFAGCAPAWKPTGELTFIRGGSVMAVPRGCDGTVDECARAILSRGDVRRGLAREIPQRATAIVREIAWLDGERMAGVLRGSLVPGRRRPVNDFVAVFDRRRLAAPAAFGFASISSLAVDRAAGRIFPLVGGGVFAFDDRGHFTDPLTVPGIPEVRSLAFSPDGRWAAAAGRGSVLVFQPGDPAGPKLPAPVRGRIGRLA